MRVLCLADLHRLELDKLAVLEQDQWIAGLLREHDPDVVVIAGDVFDETSRVNLYEELTRLFGDRPVVCTLGNHEFFGHTVEAMLSRCRRLHDPNRWNVHYLDVVVGSYDFGDIHFLGNVLWYDGSMRTVLSQSMGKFAGGRWRGREIVDLDWTAGCGRCVDAILGNEPCDGKVGVLVTHCVPHVDLNGHMSKVTSEFNAYGGVTWLLDKVTAQWAICGQTHLRVVDRTINGIICVNVGNDY